MLTSPKAPSGQEGAIFVETTLLLLVLLPCLFGLLWLGMILDYGVKLEDALRTGIRASVPQKSSPIQYVSAIEANIITAAAERNVAVTAADITICPVKDFSGSYAPPVPPRCSPNATGGYGEPFYVLVNVKRAKFFGFVPMELNLTGEGFFIY